MSESADGQARLGAGTLVSGGAFGGTVVRADSVSAVLALIADDLSASVLFTDQASATAFSPILPGLGGVVCTAGGEAAHLAIVARGLALSCVMGAELDRDPQPGEEVRIDADGTVWTIGP